MLKIFKALENTKILKFHTGVAFQDVLVTFYYFGKVFYYTLE